MLKQIVFEFERGGKLSADLLTDLAPCTIQAILASLPKNSTIFHTRWCGREIYAPTQCDQQVKRENQTSQVNTGDVTFWREWGAESSPEAISLYYGAEQVRYITGPLQVNVFARISQEQWPMIEQIGLRVWQEGTEKVKMKLA